jgi:hypothetical protein
VNGELLETHFEFDHTALERAVEIGASVSVIAVAPRYAVELLRRALALGASEAKLIETDELPGDAPVTARLLAQQITGDLVLCSEPLLAIALEGNLGRSCVCIAPGPTTRQFSVEDYFAAMNKPMRIVNANELSVETAAVARYALPAAPASEEKVEATPQSAAALLRKLAGIGGGDGERTFPEMLPAKFIPKRDAAVFLGAPDRLEGLELAHAFGLPVHLVLLENPDNHEAALAAMQTFWKDTLPPVVAAGVWANELLARFAGTFPRVQARFGVTGFDDGKLVMPAFGGKVQRIVSLLDLREHPLVATFSGSARLTGALRGVYRIELPAVEKAEAKSIAEAEFIIDVGYALCNRENFDLIVGPLKKRLDEIGVKNVMVGGTRKVVEELKLLAPAQQIGQTCTAVNPRLIISIGISGAPQHVDYIGERATVIAFNKDAEAPLMTLNQRRARPKVVPIVGDLFETVPQFTAALLGRA